MQPATIRRLLVFGVCLVGVGCLYLVPSMAGSPGRLRSSPTEQAPSTIPATTTTQVSATSPHNSAAQEPTSGTARSATLTSGSKRQTPTIRSAEEPRRPSIRGTWTAATAVEPGRDEVPPAAVGPLTVLSASAERLRIGWPEGSDDVGVVGYSVWLNGFLVQVTQETRATLAWFNDSDTHVIQVRAVDAAGNQGPSSPTLMVIRPTPTERPPSPAPSPASPTGTPAPSPIPSGHPDATPAPDPGSVAPAQLRISGSEEDGS